MTDTSPSVDPCIECGHSLPNDHHRPKTPDGSWDYSTEFPYCDVCGGLCDDD